ncbi:Hydrogenase 3 maturation protease [subsurface metagenome]
MINMANRLLLKLKKRLRGKVVIVGIGNTLRGDDGAGPELIGRLKNAEFSTLNPKLSLIDVGEVPENYLGKIAEHNPDTIMLVDAVDFGSPPGSIRIIEQDALKEDGFSTHNASINLTIKYLRAKTESSVFILGIQPTRNLKMGSRLSEPVKQAVRRIEESLIRCMVISM